MRAVVKSTRCRQSFTLVAGLLVGAALAAVAARADEADDQFAVASTHYAHQNWKLAVDEFQAFLSKYPEHRKAGQSVFLLAEALLQAGQSEEAAKQFRLYLRREPAGEYARQANFRSAEAAYLAGDFAVARRELDYFLVKYPGDKLNAYVLPYLGDVALAQKDASAAAKYFRDGLEQFSQGRLQDDCRLGLGRALEMLDKNDEAERLYLAVAAKAGSRLADEAQFRLGAVQYATGRFDQAIETLGAFDSKLAESPWQPQARLGRGWALLRLNRLDEAKAAFASVVADPKQELTPSVRFHAGDALLKSGDPAAASKQFDLVIARGPDGNEWFADALRGKVQVAFQAKDYAAIDRLAAQFGEQCAQSPLKIDVNRLRATALLERKDYAAAVKLLEPLSNETAAGEHTLDDRYLLALAYEGLRRYDDALTVLRPLLDAATGRLKTDSQLLDASLLVAKRRYADAIGPLEEVLATAPSGDAAIKVQGELAICYARNGQLDKARKLYGELLEKFPKHELMTPTTEQLAEAAYDAREVAWAAELFDRLRSAGGTVEYEQKGLAGLGWSQFKGGELAEASATFEQLLHKDPPARLAAEAALVRGQILEQLGQADAAVAMFDLVVEKYPKAAQHPEAMFAAARLRDKLQQGQQATVLYERLAKEYPEFAARDAVLYQWAWSLMDQNKADEAAALFAQLRKEYPNSRFSADAAYRLAQRALGAKDYAQAKQLTAELLAANPEEKLREHARYLQGQIAVAEQNWDEVRRVFETLLQESPQSSLRLVAEYWIAETIYRRGEYDAAGARFEQLAQEAKGRSDSWLAMIPLRRAQVLAQQKKWDEAYAIASKIEADFPNFQQQYEVDYLLGRCLHDRAELQSAREAFQKVIRSPSGAKTETAAMAQWMIGETYFHQKNYAAAMREYLRLEALYAYPTWQAAALLQAGKCHELLGESKEAAQLYARLMTDYAQTSFAEEAAQRLHTTAAQGLGSSR